MGEGKGADDKSQTPGHLLRLYLLEMSEATPIKSEQELNKGKAS